MSMFLKNINTNINLINSVKAFSTSSIRCIDTEYAKQHKLPRNLNRHGPLCHWPDYSFKDGRPTPVGVRERTRMLRQKEWAETIHKYVKEVDYAVERHKRLQEEKERENQMILDRKLKPKGEMLLLQSPAKN